MSKKSKSNRSKRSKSRRTDVEFTSIPPPPWLELPGDVTANILRRLGTIEILECAQKVCTTWRNVCQMDPTMWHVIDMKNSGDLYNLPYNLTRMCCQAVDRSQGQAIDIKIEYFGNDEMLRYISERCGELKCLTVACCRGLSGEGLHEAVKKFPRLEELHILFSPFISARDVEAIGRSCPLLRSFTYNELIKCYPLIEDDDYAFAIARSMPGLRHLQLYGNTMTNNGLQAILDGCFHLESLDVQQCFNVVLGGGDIHKRCSQQIKHLRGPHDTIQDHDINKFTSHFQSFHFENDDLFYYDSSRYCLNRQLV